MGELTESEIFRTCTEQFNSNVDVGRKYTHSEEIAFKEDCMENAGKDPEVDFRNSIADEYQNIHESVQSAVMISGGAPVLVVIEPDGSSEQNTTAQLSAIQAASVLGNNPMVSIDNNAPIGHQVFAFALAKDEDIHPIKSDEEGVIGALSKYAGEEHGIVIHMGQIENPSLLQSEYGAIVNISSSELDIKVDPSMNIGANDIKDEVENASIELMPEESTNTHRGAEFTIAPDI